MAGLDAKGRLLITSNIYFAGWYVLVDMVFGFDQSLDFLYFGIKLEPLLVHRLRHSVPGNSCGFQPSTDIVDCVFGRSKDIVDFLSRKVVPVIWGAWIGAGLDQP